jgi:bacteriorhodopsin
MVNIKFIKKIIYNIYIYIYMNPVIKFLNTDAMVKNSFYLTYVFLLTTATITFIEAMRTKIEKARHILNLETCISVVAAYFYGKFVKIINEPNIDYKKINMTRYLDWAITTPIMLLVLCLAFLFNTGGRLKFKTFLMILLFNYLMLFSGYAGSTNMVDKYTAWGVGFLFFFALYGFIYKKFIEKKPIFDNLILYWSFVIFWSGYGLVYLYPDKFKNVAFNYLDLFAKCFVGIFFWAYFTKTFTLK